MGLASLSFHQSESSVKTVVVQFDLSLLNCATTVKTHLGSRRFHCPGALKVTTCMTQLVDAMRFAVGLNLPFFDVT